MDSSHEQLLTAATNFLWGDNFLDTMDAFMEEHVCECIQPVPQQHDAELLR